MKTKVIFFVATIILLITFAGIYFVLREKWRDEAVAIQEINNIFLRYPDAPAKILNSNDPPLNSDIWYDRSLGLENAIIGIDQDIKEIEISVRKGYLGVELLSLIKMPVELLAEKVISGEAPSQYVMGIRKKIGAKVRIDLKEYQRLLKLSAHSRFPLALRETALNLKMKYEEDEEKTDASDFIINNLFENYMLDAANLDDPVAMYFVASFYYFSNDEKKGMMTAGSWFQKCLKKNEIISSFLCHKFFILKLDPKDRFLVYPDNLSIEDSYKYILDLANTGVPAAQQSLAEMSWNGQIPENYLAMPYTDAAMMWHHKAADAGRMKSQEFLGLAYAEGEIIPRDLSMASKWLELAASQGSYSASRLGIRYLMGDGVKKEQAKAVKWLTIGAVFEDNKDSQYQIGQFYWNGSGVPKNLVAAYAWINVANTSSLHDESLSTLKVNLSDSEVLKAEELSRRIYERIQKHKRAKRIMTVR